MTGVCIISLIKRTRSTIRSTIRDRPPFLSSPRHLLSESAELREFYNQRVMTPNQGEKLFFDLRLTVAEHITAAMAHSAQPASAQPPLLNFFELCEQDLIGNWDEQRKLGEVEDSLGLGDEQRKLIAAGKGGALEPRLAPCEEEVFGQVQTQIRCVIRRVDFLYKAYKLRKEEKDLEAAKQELEAAKEEHHCVLKSLKQKVLSCERRLQAAEDAEAREQYELTDVNTRLEVIQALLKREQQEKKHLDAEIPVLEEKTQRAEKKLADAAGDSGIPTTRAAKRRKQGPQKHAETRPFFLVPFRL